MTLPRPLKQVLRDEPQDAAIVRTWVRLQRTRRAGERRAVPWLIAATVLGVATAVIAWPEPPVTTPTVSTLLARGRQQAPTRATQTTRVLSTSVASEPQKPTPPPDVVGALIESAAEAMRAKDYERAAALLSEVARHHEDDPRAPTVLIALGRIQLESLHRHDDAARNFTRALELGPPEDLVVPTWKALEQAQR